MLGSLLSAVILPLTIILAPELNFNFAPALMIKVAPLLIVRETPSLAKTCAVAAMVSVTPLLTVTLAVNEAMPEMVLLLLMVPLISSTKLATVPEVCKH